MSKVEQAFVLQTVLGTLNEAYSGFLVTFATSPTETRLVTVKDALGNVDGQTAVGYTPYHKPKDPPPYVSYVYFWTVLHTLLDQVGCRTTGFDGCTTYPRADLVKALGRGIGATIAHELGHQAWFGWTRDDGCAECYDNVTAVTPRHFFGPFPLKWSDRARDTMRDVLLPAPASRRN